jgi:hypothetical protein
MDQKHISGGTSSPPKTAPCACPRILVPPPPHGYQTQKLHHEWTISIKLLLSDIDHIASKIPVRIGNVPSRLHPTAAHWLAYLPIGYVYSTWSLIN